MNYLDYLAKVSTLVAESEQARRETGTPDNDETTDEEPDENQP